MTKEQLIELIQKRNSFLCVGLDPDLEKIPKTFHQSDNPILSFCKTIVDITRPYCVAYKPNLAFFEAYSEMGLSALKQIIHYIGNEHFIISDAKRGDIGNTAAMYAKATFEHLNADAITLSPYMGKDSITPFLDYKNKWSIVLALTSNTGSADFQQLKTVSGQELYMEVLEKVATWGTPDNLMYVIGATKPSELAKIREAFPEHFFLIPGVGTQGGSLEEVYNAGKNKEVGILVNVSRAILYPSDGQDFERAVLNETKNYQSTMQKLLSI